MKKMYVLAGLCLGMMCVSSCGNSENKDHTTAEPASVNVESTVEMPKGKELIEASDCRGCHAVDSKVVGPAYIEVAKKYENNDENVTMLAQKVIKGGQGVWGEVPMTPHSDLSETDAKEIIKYILSIQP